MMHWGASIVPTWYTDPAIGFEARRLVEFARKLAT